MILLILSFNLGNSVRGIPNYVRDLPMKYKDECITCHITPSGMGGLNQYGADFNDFGYSVSSISNIDSDGDGFTNGQEFESGTFPGDPDSYSGSGIEGIPLEILVFFMMLAITVLVLYWLRLRLK